MRLLEAWAWGYCLGMRLLWRPGNEGMRLLEAWERGHEATGGLGMGLLPGHEATGGLGMRLLEAWA